MGFGNTTNIPPACSATPDAAIEFMNWANRAVAQHKNNSTLLTVEAAKKLKDLNIIKEECRQALMDYLSELVSVV